jgi:hypothetical protein
LIDLFIVFNATFSNISVLSWRPVLVVGEAGLPGDNHRPCALPIYGRWFSPGNPASPTTKTGRHDKTEILLKVALNAINKSIRQL